MCKNNRAIRPLTEKEKQLVMDNINLVYSEWKNLYHTPLINAWKEDMCQEALYCLCRCAQEYDPSTGFEFSTLACTAIKRAFLNFIRWLNNKVTLDDSGDVPAYKKDASNENSPTVFTSMEDSSTDWDRIDDKLNLSEALDILSDLQRKVILLWADGYDGKYIAKTLNTSPTAVFSTIRTAKKKIKAFYKTGEIIHKCGHNKATVVGNGNYYIDSKGNYKPICRLTNWKNSFKN